MLRDSCHDRSRTAVDVRGSNVGQVLPNERWALVDQAIKERLDIRLASGDTTDTFALPVWPWLSRLSRFFSRLPGQVAPSPIVVLWRTGRQSFVAKIEFGTNPFDRSFAYCESPAGVRSFIKHEAKHRSSPCLAIVAFRAERVARRAMLEESTNSVVLPCC